MSGDFSLLKYFKSFCEIKCKAATDCNLKQCGPFDDFEFVIYTNGKIESKSPLQGGDSDPVSILSSGTDCGKYIALDKTHDKDIFGFFEELSRYDKLIKELDSQLKSRATVNTRINEKIKGLQKFVTNQTILGKLKGLKKKVGKCIETGWIDELAKCDINLYEEFLKKVKIFQCQANVESMKELTEKELQGACKASPSIANCIFTKLYEDFSEWCKREGNVEWLDKNSELWQEVEKKVISEIKEISEPEIQEIKECGIRFNQKHVQTLSDAIKQNTVLNIVTNSSSRILQKLKTYQALNNLVPKNSLFICIKSLMNKNKEINKIWPCMWNNSLVVDCDSDCNMDQVIFKILELSADSNALDISDGNTLLALVNVLQKYQQKLILISPRQKNSVFREKLRDISYFEDNCNISDLDEKSRTQILERPVKFQGTEVSLSTLIGTDPPEIIKALLDSDAISILLSKEQELNVGRHLSGHCKHYVPRELRHQIYLQEKILKLTDYAFTFAVSGLRADELKKYKRAGEKICEIVYDETERIHTFKTVSDFSKTGLSTEMENMKAYNEAGQKVKPEEVRYIILGNKNLDSEFKEVKKLCRNVHWIHVEEGSFLWKDTKGNIDIIRRYIDNTKYETYDMKSAVEHDDRTMLLVAEAGMGKSTFLSNMEHEIKKWNPSVWVLRINLNEHTKEFEDIEFEQKCIDKCKKFLWSAAHSPEQDALKVTEKIFLQALEQTGKMVIILDGFDEISPDYSSNVEVLIKAVRDKTASKIWISSRSSYRHDLEDIVRKFAFTLQPFTQEDQIKFLEQYWSEGTKMSKQEKLQTFAKKLLKLCSEKISDKDGEFTRIPLQTMILGDAFVNEVKKYCCSGKFNLPKKFKLLSLFKKFTENKFVIYFLEKNQIDPSKPEAKKKQKELCREAHDRSLTVLDLSE